jgi:hypothetical protein
MRGRDDLDLREVESVLEKTDLGELRDFLQRELEKRPDMAERFMARFSRAEKGKSLTHYKGMVESLYDDAECHGYISYGTDIDFAPMHDLAEISMNKEDFQEAARIYQALTETIAEKMDEVDDSDGYYGQEFSEGLGMLADCIIDAGAGWECRRPYIKYLMYRYLKNDPDYFQDDYNEALKKVCTTDDDLLYWKELLEPHIPAEIPDSNDWSRHCGAHKLISMQLIILFRLGDMAGFYSLIEKHYRSDRRLCLWYARQLLEDGDREKAVLVAEEGVAIFPEHQSGEIRGFLNGIYRKADPKKYRETLQSLFLTEGDWKYYDSLKKASPPEEWSQRLEAILEYYKEVTRWGGFGRERVIDIYLKEGMYDKAISNVLGHKRLFTLSTYQNELGDRYPEEYFNAYRELIVPFAGSGTGRKHYKEVVSYLNKMKKIEGFGGAVSEIVKQLRAENRRKPAFIEEMKEL